MNETIQDDNIDRVSWDESRLHVQLTREQVKALEYAPEIARNEQGQSLMTADVLVIMNLPRKAADSGEQIAAMRSNLDAVKEASAKAERSSTEGMTRLERKLDDMLPRREFDARVLLLESEQRKADIRLREIDLEILKLKNNI